MFVILIDFIAQIC